MAATWDRWLATHSSRDRDALIEHYGHLVERVSRSVPVPVERYGEHYDPDELVACGYLGLLQAVENFRLEDDVDVIDRGQLRRFEVFAAKRIRGSILDELRMMAWIPRTVKDRVREVNHARGQFQHRHGRHPTPTELATEARLTTTDVRRAEQYAVTLDLDSVDAKADFGVYEVADLYADPLMGLGVNQLRWRLAEAIATALDDRERAVMALCFREHLTLIDAGVCLGVSKVRISQIQTDALHKLAAALGAAGERDDDR